MAVRPAGRSRRGRSPATHGASRYLRASIQAGGSSARASAIAPVTNAYTPFVQHVDDELVARPGPRRCALAGDVLERLVVGEADDGEHRRSARTTQPALGHHAAPRAEQDGLPHMHSHVELAPLPIRLP